MAHKNRVFLASLLLATTALAQTADSRNAIDLTKGNQTNAALPKQVALARCAYRQTDEGCPSAPLATDLKADHTLAQMPRRVGPVGRQGPPMRGYAYPESWGPQFSPGHALVGAAIGFAFGAAAGSKSGVRSSLAVGTLVGLVGAAIGAGIPSFPHYRRRGWDDDEEASRRKQKRPRPDASHPESATEVAASRSEPSETYQKNAFSRR